MRDFSVTPNLENYEEECAEFSWSKARRELNGLPSGGLNIAHEAVDRHATGTSAQHLALRWLKKNSSSKDHTFADPSLLTNRFGNALHKLGIEKGEVVSALMGRIPELYITALGTWKNQNVFCPLFSAFGPEPIKARMTISEAQVLVTTAAIYERKVARLREKLPALKFVIVIGEEEKPTSTPGTLDFHKLLNDSSDLFTIQPTNPEDAAILHFTSGTTGTPKGALHVHEAVVAHHITGKFALDLHRDDVFWCTADPGWVTGTSYGIIAPLTNGVSSIVDEGDFDAERWYRILEEQHVSVWYTAPTAIRLMMKCGIERRSKSLSFRNSVFSQALANLSILKG